MSKFVFLMFLFLTASTYAKTEKVFFVYPKDGAVVGPKFTAKFGLEGLSVKPAGEDMDNKKAGHFHILVNKEFFPADQVIPADENHIHYGKGQTEAELKLAPGKYKLTLQFADGAHRSSGQKLSQTISVTVKARP